MKALLFLNGDPPPREVLKKAAQAKKNGAFVCCTDGAYTYVSAFMLPNLVVGDFDSLQRGSVDPACEVATFAAEKDFTDGYLAMQILLTRGYRDIDVFGAFGGRADMQASNYTLLVLAHKAGAVARLVGRQTVYFTDGDFRGETKKGAVVSLVPFGGSTHIVYTVGLQYALKEYTLDMLESVGSPHYVMGVSNRSEGKFEVKLSSGALLVFIEENR